MTHKQLKFATRLVLRVHDTETKGQELAQSSQHRKGRTYTRTQKNKATKNTKSQPQPIN